MVVFPKAEVAPPGQSGGFHAAGNRVPVCACANKPLLSEKVSAKRAALATSDFGVRRKGREGRINGTSGLKRNWFPSLQRPLHP